MNNTVKIKVEGSISYPLNLLSKNGIDVRKAHFGSNFVSFYIGLKDMKKAEKILLEGNRKYEIVERRGFKEILRRTALRAGAIAGIIISVIFTLLYSFCTFTINITGNELIPTETIEGKIREIVKLPAFYQKIDAGKLEKMIISIGGISSASVDKKGTAINVNILEELPLTTPEEIKTSFEPIKSKYDGIITRIIPTHGTCTVKAGDTVKKGQILIQPYIMADENTQIMTKAGGEIYGRVWYTKSAVYYPQISVFKRTGNKETFCDTDFFQWKKKIETKFSSYEIEEKSYYAGNILPLKIKEFTYYETEEVSEDFDFDASSDLIISDLTKELEKELPSEGKIKRNWYIIKRLDKIVYLDIYYEIEIQIV